MSVSRVFQRYFKIVFVKCSKVTISLVFNACFKIISSVFEELSSVSREFGENLKTVIKVFQLFSFTLKSSQLPEDEYMDGFFMLFVVLFLNLLIYHINLTVPRNVAVRVRHEGRCCNIFTLRIVVGVPTSKHMMTIKIFTKCYQ